MASDSPDTNDMVIRQSFVSTDHARSRMIKRGLDALHEVRKVCLDVDMLVAFESSLFIFAQEWDLSAWGRYEIPAWRQFWSEPPDKRQEIWNDRRQVTFFEFHRAGAYIRKVELPLIKLTAEGFGKIADRDCVSITTRSNFIYFREHFWMWADSGTESCHVHYLFSRTGDRRAVWSSSDLVDRYRLRHEPTVPTEVWPDPDLIDENSLITLKPGEEALESFPQYMSPGKRIDSTASTSNYVLAFQDAEEWITHINRLQETSPPAAKAFSLPVCLPKYSEVALAPSRSLGSYRSHVGMESDPKSLWLLGDERRENDTLERSIRRIELNDFQARVTNYFLPHPYDLIRQGIVTLPNEINTAWIPSDADFTALKAEYENQFLVDDDSDIDFDHFDVLNGSLGNDSEYEGRYEWLGAWGNDVVLSTYFKNQQPDGDRAYHFLLFRVENGDLNAVRRLDSGRKVDLHWRTTPTFADGHLYLPAAVWDHNRRVHDWTIRIIDVNTNAVSYFRPEVPESELENAFGTK